MKAISFFVRLSLLMLAFVCFISCEDDNDNSGKHPTDINGGYHGAFILNQGNFYSQIAGSIGVLSYSVNEFPGSVDSVFFSMNGILPGNTLQAGAIYGNHFYAIAYESNVMFVCDKNLKLQHQLRVDSPRALAVDGGYVYVSNYNGHVSKIDTTTMTVVSTIAVGPNPEEMAVSNGYLYVTNSDGLNYMNGYVDGKSVSKIKLSSFTLEKTIPVGLNPTKACADSCGNVFIIAMGDYASVPATIQKIDQGDNVTDVAEATIMTIHNSTLYAINSVTDWNTYQTVNTYFSIDTKTMKRTNDIITEGVNHPLAIAVDPFSNHLFITSYADGAYGADYVNAGYLKEYSAEGNYISTYKTGVAPVQLVFFN